MNMYVRVKHYNPKKGFFIQRYHTNGQLFQEQKGWYLVDESLAKLLKKKRQVANDPDSRPIFDICTKEEALEMERGERKREQEKARVREARLMGKKNTGALPIDELEEKEEEEEVVNATIEEIGRLEQTSDGSLSTSGIKPKKKIRLKGKVKESPKEAIEDGNGQ